MRRIRLQAMKPTRPFYNKKIVYCRLTKTIWSIQSDSILRNAIEHLLERTNKLVWKFIASDFENELTGKIAGGI